MTPVSWNWSDSIAEFQFGTAMSCILTSVQDMAEDEALAKLEFRFALCYELGERVMPVGHWRQAAEAQHPLFKA